MKHLQILLCHLNDFGVVININKCVFGRPEDQFVGYIISKDGTKPLQSKGEVCSIIIVVSCPKQLKLKLHFWIVQKVTPVRLEAFAKCKNQQANAALLAHPSTGAKLCLMVGASDSAIGGWQPLSFFSKRLSSAERNYSTYDRELLAINASIKHFQDLLEATTSPSLLLSSKRTKKLLLVSSVTYTSSENFPQTFNTFLEKIILLPTLFLISMLFRSAVRLLKSMKLWSNRQKIG